MLGRNIYMNIFGKDPAQDLIIIAEIGVNHEGGLDYAKELIRLAASTGADAVKFQSYTPERYACKENMERFERVKRFSLSQEDHLELIEFARLSGIEFFSTPLSEDWVQFLNKHSNAFKIASGDITFEPVIRAVAQTGKPFIISTGAANIEEIDKAVDWVKDEIGEDKAKENLALMHCICSYPAPIEQANILSVPFLAQLYGLHVGYSNHVIESEACLTAVALGANIIEVHFTDRKTGRDFHDHALSFEPQELTHLIKSANLIKKSLGSLGKFVQPCEQDLVLLVRKGIVAANDLRAGQVLGEDDLIYARPSTEFSSAELKDLIGKTLKQDIASGHLIKRESV